ncbi:CLUMA_CG008796, isoform A [Clunio marinus]|uniref:CLUMA_CG008796, isoform A n=1 Tax=Clunio marinus TaxID=568069 RepID=A0A1J1IAD4_9DIPT|nr:CLUMA_CG008796, isoform A [Clunio marinus]
MFLFLETFFCQQNLLQDKRFLIKSVYLRMKISIEFRSAIFLGQFVWQLPEILNLDRPCFLDVISIGRRIDITEKTI